MAERWVLNASPIIVLGKVGQAHLFAELAEDLVVPTAVMDEITARPADDPARLYLQEPGHLKIVEAPGAPADLRVRSQITSQIPMRKNPLSSSAIP